MKSLTTDMIINTFMMIWYSIGIALTSVMLMLDPLRRFALERKLPIQFSFADLYILMGMLSVTGLFLSLIRDGEIRAAVIVTIWLALVASWYYGVRLVSRSGIASMRQRLLVQLVATPLAACGPFLILAVFFFATNQIPTRSTTPRLFDFQFFWLEISLASASDVEAVEQGLRWIALILLVALYLIVPRRLARQAIATQGYIPPPKTTELPQKPGEAPLLDPHMKDLKLK